MCQCGRDKIVYRCYQEGCQEYKNFCVECKDDDIHKHLPFVVRCFEVIANSDNRWSLINERYDKSVKAAIASYQKVAPLVKYFEAVSINIPLNQGAPPVHRCITADHQHLLSMNEKLGKIMTQVESISKDGSIDLIDGINS
jgi:hypothetical protein